MALTPELHTLSIGLPRPMQTQDRKQYISAICKQKTAEAFLTKESFKGDDIADKKHHGGPDRAVCVYPAEHYALWEEEFSCKLPSSTFGENLTVNGMLEADVCIGDVFQVGEAVIQVTQGRIPCSTIDKRTALPGLMKRMIDTGFTGYLCRVLQEGTIRSDSAITLLARDPHGVTILFANEVYFQRPKDGDGMRRIAAVEALAEEWQKKIEKRLASLQKV